MNTQKSVKKSELRIKIYTYTIRKKM